MSKAAVVTGVSRGIGREVLRGLVSAGHESLAIGLNAPQATDGVRFVRSDLATRAGIDDACRGLRVFLEEGQHDYIVLVNNSASATPAPLEDLSPDEIVANVVLNLIAPVLLSQAALAGMRRCGSGTIINIGSTAARVHPQLLSTYASTKGGLQAFTQTLAGEVARHGISVNCVVPGLVDTSGGRSVRRRLSKLLGLDAEEYERQLTAKMPGSRLVSPVEVAEVVLWLAISAPRSLTGETIGVSGPP